MSSHKGLVAFAVLVALAVSPARADTPAERARRAEAYFGNAVLRDQDGKTLRFYDDLLHDKIVVISVMFSSCSSACPLMTTLLRGVREQLGERFGKSIHFVSISVDPNNDDPAKLKRFAQRHRADEPGWRFVVASPAVTKELLGRLGQWVDAPADHNTMLFAGNVPRGHWIKLRPGMSAEQIAAELDRIVQ